MSRVIVHLDADAFFASVEQAADPRLRGKPVAVGGEKRGIVASASYEARKYGIFTPMPTLRARKLCPKLIVLPGDFEKYERFSRWMFSYAYDFTPDVEIGSIDEGYFDLSGTRRAPLEVAQTIGRAIRQALKISVSEGIGANKLVSQIASKLNKPAAFFHVPAGHETCFLHPLPVLWLPGVGPKTAQRLRMAGLAQIRHVAATPVDLLSLLVGRAAPTLREFSHGLDERPVVPVHAPAKSYGHQETFAQDQTDEVFLCATLRRMADQLMTQVREDRKSIRTLTVKVRYNDMAEDQAGESLAEPTDLETDLYGRLELLLSRAWKRRVSLRLVALKFSGIYDGIFAAELLLDGQAQRRDARRRLAASVDELRRAHGRGVLFRGHDFVPVPSHAPQPPGKAAPYPSGASAPVQLRDEIRTHRLLVERHSPSPPLKFRGQQMLAARPRRVATPTYLPLEIHSYYSFLDSTLPIEAIVAWAAERNLPALALTDTGNLHGAVSFVQAARAAGIRPILGAALHVDGAPIRLLVESALGYRHLCRILSQPAPPDSAPPQPEERISSRRARAVLEEGTEGLIAISPCPDLAPLFPGRFYLAVSDPRRWGRRLAEPNLPAVATLPMHYGEPQDRWKYEVVQSIRTLTLLRQTHPKKKLTGGRHLRGPRDMAALFADFPELLARTGEIAERCLFELPFGQPQFPAYAPSDGSTPRVFLRGLVLEGARRRYGECYAQVVSQLEEELTIIGEVGYEEYFLIMWDILQECRRRNIEWITRGSAADSLVCYCLEISDVCPIRFELYFRRFLNRERMALNKLPDIDVDFAHDRKDDVVDLIFEKFGSKQTAVVGGFSTYQARSALGDVAKVLGVSEYQIRRVTERLPYYSRAHDLEEITSNGECADLPLLDEPCQSALRMAQFLSGFPRHSKMHPCGLVLSRQSIHELTPTFISNKGYPTTHFDMDAIETVGLIKMDILAQGGLAVMRDVKKICDSRLAPCDSETGGRGEGKGKLPKGLFIRHSALDIRHLPGRGLHSQFKNQKLKIPSAPWEDPGVWDLIANGEARAVHHIESPAMISLCRMCNVRDIDTLIAIVSVIRPGAANESKKMEFARRYQGLAPTVYPHPCLEPCLRSTFGLVVYEEHILQICEAFAGLPPGRADVLRRALGKEKEEVVEEIGGEFAQCARNRGRADEEIKRVWELVTGFRGYAFCKAHSTAYGVEAYEAAWLKRNYPAEFLAAVLTHGKGFYSPLVYVLECHRLRIGFLPPSINEPGPAFIPHPASPPQQPRPTIRVPAVRVKGLTQRTIERLLTEHGRDPFPSLEDFYRRVLPLPEEMESLLRVGAFDCFGKTRTTQFWECQLLKQAYAGSASGQEWLFGDGPLAAGHKSQMPREPTRRECLQWEAELLDFCVSAHPLELHENIAWETYCSVAELGQHIGERVVACGLVIEQRLHHQVTGEPMKFLTLADWTGMVETELFASTYKSYGLATVRYPVLEVTATVEPFENGRGFSLRVHRAGKPRTRDDSSREPV